MSAESGRPLRIGTRGSLLARTQAGAVAAAFTASTGIPAELVIMRTEGDDLRVPLDAPSRPGAFVATLRDALLAGEIDAVVHSAKDLPSEPLNGLVIAAIPPREDPRDALISRHPGGLAGLPVGARVGTSSPRRVAALSRLAPQVVCVPLRGNIDTRLAAVGPAKLDATLLAMAGLRRIARDASALPIDPGELVPAPAQGALAVECRSSDQEIVAALGSLDDPATRLCATAERSVLSAVGATCTTAIGAWAHLAADGELVLLAELSGHQGVQYQRVRVSVGSAGSRGGDQESGVALGRRAGALLLAAEGG
ncbi:MAG: hydroxymethylbilane synthase [Candidatus Nanopelagicales bacterium]